LDLIKDFLNFNLDGQPWFWWKPWWNVPETVEAVKHFEHPSNVWSQNPFAMWPGEKPLPSKHNDPKHVCLEEVNFLARTPWIPHFGIEMPMDHAYGSGGSPDFGGSRGVARLLRQDNALNTSRTFRLKTLGNVAWFKTTPLNTMTLKTCVLKTWIFLFLLGGTPCTPWDRYVWARRMDHAFRSTPWHHCYVCKELQNLYTLGSGHRRKKPRRLEKVY